jgi:hypothetical protein
MALTTVLLFMIIGCLIVGMCHVILLYRIQICLQQIKDERVLIAQINSAEKWV